MMDIKTDLVQKTLACFSCTCVLLAGSAAYGWEIQAETSAGIGMSDNITRSEDVPIEETMGLAGLNLALTEETPRLTADVRAQFDYLYYADGTFDNELVGGLAATLNFTIVDERLIWLVQETFGQQLVDPLSPSSPGNRENVSYFTTGPTLSLLPGSRNNIQVDLLYSSVNYEVRPADNERLSAALELGRQTGRDTRLSLVANTTQVDYKSDLATDFDRHEAFIRYEINGSRNTFAFDLGVTEVDVADVTGDGTLVRLNWIRRISVDKTFVLTGGSNYSDQGDIFRFNQSGESDLRNTGDVIPGSAPFTNNFASISYVIDRERTSLNIDLSFSQEDYAGEQQFDRDTYGVNFSFSRDLSERLFAGLNFQYREREFTDLGTADDDLFTSAELGYRFGPSSSVSLQYAYFERSGDTAFVQVQENRLFVRFFFTPAWGR